MKKIYGYILLTTMLLLTAGNVWAQGDYGLEVEYRDFGGNHNVVHFDYNYNSNVDGGRCNYLNVKFYFLGDRRDYFNGSIEVDNLATLVREGKKEWTELSRKTLTAPGKGSDIHTILYYRVTYEWDDRNRPEGRVDFAIAFPYFNEIKENLDYAEFNHNNLWFDVSTYANKAASSDENNAKRRLGNHLKLDLKRQPNIKTVNGLGWFLEPMLDMNASEKEIGRKTAVIHANDSVKLLITNVGNIDFKENSGYPQVSIPKDVTELRAYLFQTTYCDRHYKSVSELLPACNEMTSIPKEWYVSLLKIKPFIPIDTLEVTKTNKLGDNGENKSAYTIKWYLKEDPSGDVSSDDQFLVIRSHKEDFLDPTIISNVPLSKCKKEGDRWVYTVEDADEEAFYNSSEYGQKVYYRVVRSIVYAQWPNHKGDYCKTAVLDADTYLPKVRDVSVTKTSDFEDTKTVKVKVILGNLTIGGRKYVDLGLPSGNLWAKENINADSPVDRDDFFPWGETNNLAYNDYVSWQSYKWGGYDWRSVKKYTHPDNQTEGDWYKLEDGKYVFKGDNLTELKPEDDVAFVKWGSCWGIPNHTQFAELINPEYTTMTWINSGYKITSKTTGESLFLPGSGNRTGMGVSDSGMGWYWLRENNTDNSANAECVKFSDGGIEFSAQERYVAMTVRPISLQKYIDTDFSIWHTGANVVLERYSPKDEWYEGRDYAEKRIVISGDEVKYDKNRHVFYVEVEDVQGTPYTHYYYKGSVDQGSSPYIINPDGTSLSSSKEDADMCYSESIAQIKTFTVQKGEGRGGTRIEWSTGDGDMDGYELVRSTANYVETNGPEHYDYSDKIELDLGSVNGSSYYDEQAYPGNIYQYTLKGYLDVRGKRYWTKPVTDNGYTKYYARVKGKILMNDGSAWPLKTQVKLKLDTDGGVNIIPALDVNNKRLADGVNLPKNYTFTTELKEDGTFEFDSIPYVANPKNSTSYYISTTADNVKNPSGMQGEYMLSFTPTIYEYIDLNFTSDETRKVEGRIIYAGSTIPSRGIMFKVTDGNETRTIVDRNGDPVVTDNNGNYSFALPYRAQGYKVEAYKKGHKLKYDGVVQDHPGAKNVLCNIEDSTKVRLVGRLVGGRDQGDMPLGYGLSKNNLADKITIELQLEGDNTSYITYNDDDPDNTTRSANFTQKVKKNRTSGSTETYECDTTKVNFERKRIIISPDKKTGEFCLDLAPTKYKITQMYGTGYSTFFAEGEGAAVLDLSNDSTLYTVKKQVNGVDYETSYHHTYNRVYHAPVKVTYTQYVDGHETEYYGEKKLKVQTTLGKTLQPETFANGKYTFGYPVFVQGKTYQMKVYAHEDYYYNNDHKTLPNTVGIRHGKLTVNNGLKDESNKLVADLDSLGHAEFWLPVDNASFNLVAKDALRELNMSVELDGYYYESDTLRAFVTGERSSKDGTQGTDNLNMLKDVREIQSPRIELLDIIRDPYTSTGYAYRERGTKYDLHREQILDFGADFGIGVTTGIESLVNVGAWVGMGGGGYTGTTMGGGSTWTFNFTIPGVHAGGQWTGDYSVTLNERLQTSADPKDVGAMADVYVGIIPTYKLYHTEAFNVVDEKTLNYLKDSEISGRIKVVQEGQDAENKKYYLIIADQTSIAPDKSSTFAYSQKHILYNVVPELVRRLDEMVVNGIRDSVQALADKNQRFYYRIIKDEYNFMTGNDWYEIIRPRGNPDLKLDEANQIINSIRAWLSLIQENEQRKRNAMEGKGKMLKSYALSDMEIDYTQDAGYSYISKFNGTVLGIELKSGGMWRGIQLGLAGTESRLSNSETTKKNYTSNLKTVDKSGSLTDDKISAGTYNIEFTTPGTKWKVDVTPKISAEYSGSRTRLVTNLAGSGFHMGVEKDAYLNVDVYTEPVDTAKVGDNKAWVWNESDWKWISAEGSKDYEKLQNHDYVFVVTGGAERSPWYEPDSTNILYPSKPLGTKTMKIDNPKLYITNPMVNNLPKNERAVFSLRLTNETEYKGNINQLRICPLTLSVEMNTNPDGARLYIDGAPLGTAGLPFYLKPGESTVTTLEVERGANAYDYEDIQLNFADETYTLVDSKTFSVHYLPESTPVKITTPTDKWVMNTLSAIDDDGKYFLPVKIEGFDLNHPNFDHIEFQYKKQTEGDAAWTNLCSYYGKEDEYYQNATGTKKLIQSGSISDIRFYGDKDPMEMMYDLRAVSFTRLGTSYVTYASPVVSGTKDTRPPVLFGTPEPKEGIFRYGDNISMTFSENIAYNYLDETANFQVTGFTNTSANESQVYLNVDKDVSATSLVEENLLSHDFSIDMMAKVHNHDNQNDLVRITSSDTNTDELILREKDNHLELYKNNEMVAQSEQLKIDMAGALTHVGFTYCWDKKIVQFIAGDQLLTNNMSSQPEISTHGHIHLSTTAGITSVNNLRLWNKELTSYEVANINERKFTGNESNLMAYWPLTEGFGHVAKDLVSGNNLQVTNPGWHTKDGYSLLTKYDPVTLKGQDAYKFTREASDDYTLAFWYGNWMLKDADSINVVHAGAPYENQKDNLSIYLKKEDGKHLMKLQSEGKTFNIGQTDFSTEEWHHIALSINHTLGTANFFIDGEMTGQAPASEIGGLNTSTGLILGDQNMAGAFDEIEFWELALPANYIQKNFNAQRSGNEMGLVVYMPFETMKRDGTIYNMEFSAKNHATYTKQGQSTVNVNAREPMFDISKLVKQENVAFTARCLSAIDYECPVHSNEGIESLKFTWTGTDTKLQINLKKDDYDINGRYVNITVRGVEDLAGNPMANPMMWTVYVHRNVLSFGDKKLSATTEYGKKKTIATTVRNECGKKLSFTIDPNCTWLTPSLTYDQLDPLEEKDIQFEVSDGLSPGNYTTKVTLTDENGLATSLNVTLAVTIDEPDWKVTTGKLYTRTMNIMATVYEQKNHSTTWTIDNDPRDIVGAFINNVCVGKTNLTIDHTSGTAYLYMTIRGKESSANSDVIFRLWDASTGNIYYLSQGKMDGGKWVSEKTLFKSDTIIGGDKPVEMHTTSSRTQTINLEEGWNWISFNISTEKGNDIFMSNDMFTVNDIFKCTAGTSIYKGNGQWTPLPNFTPTKSNVYEVYVQKPLQLNVNGTAIADEDLSVELKFNKRSWAELAYLLDETIPIDEALVDFRIGQKAPVGTMIKSYNEFAIARADGKWVGSLQYMRPGTGYFVNCNGNTESKTIKYYPQPIMLSRAFVQADRADNVPVATRSHSAMMPVIATFKDGDVEQGDILVAYVGNEVVGVAQPGTEVSGEEFNQYNNLFFISVNGDNDDMVKFVKYRNGEAVAATKSGLRYDATGIAGTLENPYLIDFSDSSSDAIYDVTGVKYRQLPQQNGVYIIGNKKVYMHK